MRKAFLQIHGAVFLAGFTGILGRLITLNEALIVWYRLIITVITLWLLSYFQKKVQRIAVKDLLAVTGVGALAAVHWATFYAAIKYSNVSVALVCLSSIGFFTAVFEPLILRKRFNYVEVMLSLIAIAGIYFIFHFDPTYKAGIIIGILSAMFGSLFPIFNRQFLQRYTPDTVTVYEFSGALLFITAMLPIYLQIFPTDHLIPSWNDAGWLLILAWVCTVLAFKLSMNALKKISAFTVNFAYNLEPLYGIALAFVVFREDKLLTTAFYIGFGIILSSVFLQSYLVYREKAKKTSPDAVVVGS